MLFEEKFPSAEQENGAVLNTSSEELVLTKKQITAPMTEGPSGHFEPDLCPRRILARVGPEP